MFYKLQRFFSYIRYSIPYGIKNIFIWLPVVWDDRVWDQYWFFKLLRFKLNRMEVFFRKYGCHKYAERDAKKMKLCILLLDRILKDEYYDNAFKNHTKKWGEINLEFLEDGRLEYKRENEKTEEDKEQESKEAKFLYLKEVQQMKQDIDYLFKIIAKNIQNWWD